MTELVLHHYWRSSSSWRVRWALALKGLAYRSNAIDLLRGEQVRDEFLHSSPMGLVPCLVVDGRALTESVAIIEWLDQVQPHAPLFPADPWKRARTRQLVELINSGTQPLQNLSVLRHFSAEPAAHKSWSQHWIARGLAAFERELAVIEGEEAGEPQGPHALGDALSAADLFLAPQVYNARRFEVDLAPYPRVRRVDAAALATEAATASHPDRFQPPKA